MFLKQNKIQYLIGIFLFIFVFFVGFVKMNIVQSSSGLASSVSMKKNEFYDEYKGNININTLSNINDDSFIKIYKEDYGFDIILKINDNEKIFSLKLPWKKII